MYNSEKVITEIFWASFPHMNKKNNSNYLKKLWEKEGEKKKQLALSHTARTPESRDLKKVSQAQVLYLLRDVFMHKCNCCKLHIPSWSAP